MTGTTMPPQHPSPALFFDTISAYQRTEALRAAIELDLFTQVAAGQRTAAELAEACQASPRGVRILADYLTILGFLHKHERPLRTHARRRGVSRSPVAGLSGRCAGFPAVARNEARAFST